MSRLTVLLWRLLGKSLERRGHAELAQSCYLKAIEASPKTEAERALRLGRELIADKKYAPARGALLPLASTGIELPEFWNLLGIALRETSDLEGAGNAFRQALRLKPDMIQAQNNFGNWLLATGRPREALRVFDETLALRPDFYEATNNRLVALLELGRSAEAEQSALSALLAFPESPPLHLNLGNSYLQQGKALLARDQFRKALALDPGFEEAHYNMGFFDGGQGLGNALAYLKKSVEARPNSIDLKHRLAIAYEANSLFLDAQRTCQEIIEKQEDFAPAYVTLGNVCSILGEPGQALAAYRRAVDLVPQDARIHSNVLFELNYLCGYSADYLFEQHRAWAARHEEPLLAGCLPARRMEASPGRRIRIGYVSPDFKSHPVGYLIRGMIRAHDRQAFEIHCYARIAEGDAVTREIQEAADHWHDTVGSSDAAVADQIRADGIDILVDLAGHTGNNRLLAFARRPAPIQVSWVGYFHSTGMDSIDYFITDPYTSPSRSRQLFSETPVCLPHTRFCYVPPAFAPEVAAAPFLKNGFITFGSFNRLAKMTDEVVGAWARILSGVPGARLWLKSAGFKEEDVCENVRRRFSACGIDPERLVLRPGSGHAEMLAEYGEIDIGLDPFPFNGGMTTFEALYMGVPVVTRCMDFVVSRQSVSALSNLGLGDLAHENLEAYIEGAVRLAADPGRLETLRRELRAGMLASPLCQVPAFTRDLESLYLRMWHAWTEGRKLPSDLC